ncbi:unnamed protein product [Urochloa humidicola]
MSHLIFFFQVPTPHTNLWLVIPPCSSSCFVSWSLVVEVDESRSLQVLHDETNSGTHAPSSHWYPHLLPGSVLSFTRSASSATCGLEIFSFVRVTFDVGLKIEMQSEYSCFVRCFCVRIVISHSHPGGSHSQGQITVHAIGLWLALV